MFRALELAIGSTLDGKDVGVREDVGDDVGADVDSFLEPNFRNMKGLFMFEVVVLKLADGESKSVAIVKALFGRCNGVSVFKQRKSGAKWDLQCLLCDSKWFIHIIARQVNLYYLRIQGQDRPLSTLTMDESASESAERARKSLLKPGTHTAYVWPPIRWNQCIRSHKASKRRSCCVREGRLCRHEGRSRPANRSRGNAKSSLIRS
jgi:hypothetical protein